MVGFDCKKYLKLQTEKIKERIENSGDRLYLEFGGKLFDDYNAERVLPGFEYDAKVKLLQAFKEETEIIICICAKEIEKNKIRADHGITYSKDILRLIDAFRERNLNVSSVTVTQYKNEVSVDAFCENLKSFGIKTYIHQFIEGYPTDVEHILSEEGYGANEYIKTTKPLVVVTAPGPGSGKLATCMSQLYHEHKMGINAQYAKFETFPVWNLPLKHPVNVSYEAATADLEDVNMIDPFHLEKYNEIAVSYNRDIEMFPIIKNILESITGKTIYYSPTDMGVNMIGFCIKNNSCIEESAKQEVIRRYYRALCDNKKGLCSEKVVKRIEFLMKDLNIKLEDRVPVTKAIQKSKDSGSPSVAIKLNTGEIITGRTTNIMTGAASVILNSIKYLSGMKDDILLISENILNPIQDLKKNILNNRDNLLDINDVLTALSVCAITNPMASIALSKLKELNGTQAHSTYMLSGAEEKIYRNLKINITEEPMVTMAKLFKE